MTGSEPRFSFAFSARDLMNTAIFAAIFIVVVYVIGMLGVISPLVWLIVIPVTSIVNGITFMLFITRVKHAGMVSLFALIIALVYVLSGNTVPSTVAIIVLGVLADLVLSIGRYRSRRAAIWAYTVLGLAYVTPLLPLLIDREAYFRAASWTQMGEDYMHAADQLLSPLVIGVFLLVILVTSFFGALLGSAMLRKHFTKAGLA